MAINLHNGQWACSVCGSKWGGALQADSCRDAHEMLYIPMSKNDFNMLVHAIGFGDVSVIPDTLRETIRKYQRIQSR